jgi:hypothetical protein
MRFNPDLTQRQVNWLILASLGILLLVLGSVWAFSSLSSGSSSAPTDQVVSGESSSSSRSLQEQAYLNTLDNGRIYYADDQAAIDVAHSICGMFASGGNTWDVVYAMQDSYSGHDASWITGAAVAAYCPQYNAIAGSSGY